jgi:hypothetical protein
MSGMRSCLPSCGGKRMYSLRIVEIRVVGCLQWASLPSEAEARKRPLLDQRTQLTGSVCDASTASSSGESWVLAVL